MTNRKKLEYKFIIGIILGLLLLFSFPFSSINVNAQAGTINYSTSPINDPENDVAYVDIDIILVNRTGQIINITFQSTFVGTFEFYFDVNNDNAPDYLILWQNPSYLLKRLSDQQYWDGTGWGGVPTTVVTVQTSYIVITIPIEAFNITASDEYAVRAYNNWTEDWAPDMSIIPIYPLSVLELSITSLTVGVANAISGTLIYRSLEDPPWSKKRKAGLFVTIIGGSIAACIILFLFIPL